MKPIYTTDENDCLRCCLATILELPIEIVPNFFNGYRFHHTQFQAVDKWLTQYGYMTIELNYNEWVEAIKEFRSLAIVTGIPLHNAHLKSARGHAVVVRGNKIVYDPAQKMKSIQEFSINHFINIHLFVKLNPKLELK